MNIESPDSFYLKKKSEPKRPENEDEVWPQRSTMANCLAFMRQKQLTQEQLVRDDMEINIQLLLNTPKVNEAL